MYIRGCPKCSGLGVVKQDSSLIHTWVECNKCGLRSPEITRLDYAIEIWNNRKFDYEI